PRSAGRRPAARALPPPPRDHRAAPRPPRRPRTRAAGGAGPRRTAAPGQRRRAPARLRLLPLPGGAAAAVLHPVPLSRDGRVRLDAALAQVVSISPLVPGPRPRA